MILLLFKIRALTVYKTICPAGFPFAAGDRFKLLCGQFISGFLRNGKKLIRGLGGLGLFLLLVGEFAEDAFVNCQDVVPLFSFFLCLEMIVSK